MVKKTVAPSLTAEDHLQIHAELAAYALVAHLRGTDDDPGPILRRYPHVAAGFAVAVERLPDDIAWPDVGAWYAKFLVEIESATTDTHLPLVGLDVEGRLGLAGRIALVLAGLVENATHYGRLFAELQMPILTPRPTLASLSKIVGGLIHEGASLPELQANLVDNAIVDIGNIDDPRPDWLMQVPLPIWSVLAGHTHAIEVQYAPAAAAGRLDDLPLPETFRSHVESIGGAIANGKVSTLVLRSHRGSCASEIAATLAGSLGCGTITVDAADTSATSDQMRRLGVLAATTNSIPILVVDVAPATRVKLNRPTCWSGPIIVLASTLGGLEGQLIEGAVTIALPVEGADERRSIWRSAWPSVADDELNLLVNRLLLPAKHLREVAREAAVLSSVAGRDSPIIDDVDAASRSLDRSSLDIRAQRLAPKEGAALIATAPTHAKLAHLVRQCRHREDLADRAGLAFAGHDSRGVKALFTGRSGTGKTLAARLLATQLGMELYRLDLAMIINKYVGETEKNLHEVLAAAEEHDVLLLIDEGDALLASRTDVRSANDRYANVETDYLLQRLESHSGVVVVTTNLTDNIDQAFQRRMDVVVDFPEPGAIERQQLWDLHLPLDHTIPISATNEVAARCAFTGGQIRNAALYATLLALDVGERVNEGHFRAAVEAEFDKAGATSPLSASGAAPLPAQGLQAFLRGLQ